jgi:hypothetical protein
MTTSLNSSRSVLDQDGREGMSRIRTLTASTTITQELHDGQTLLMGASGAALTFTLPAALGTGATFKFKVSVVNTSNYIIQVANSTDVMAGGVIFNGDNASNAVTGFETAATSDTITINGTTQGGVNIGDWVELQDIKSGFWAVTGILTESGTEVTPFSAAV